MDNKNVPEWILSSTTGIEKQNDEVGLIVAGFIGAFRKRGFGEKEIGLMLAPAFLLPLEEAEKRLDAVLQIHPENREKAKELCIFAVTECGLFDNSVKDVKEIIRALNDMKF